MRAARFAVTMLAGATFVVGAPRADEIDDDVAVFDELCIANIPDVEPVRSRAAAENWIKLDKKRLQVLGGHGIAMQDGWSANIGGMEYLVRVGAGQGKLTVIREGGASASAVEGRAARCSVETARGNGEEILRRLEQKHGKSKEGFNAFLVPGSTERDAQWNIRLRDLDLMLYFVRAMDGQTPGARMEIALVPDPFAANR